FATGPARDLTYRQCWRVVQELAAHFKACGLEAGDIVGIQLPPIVEAPLTLLACWHAGLIASPLPVPWRAGEISQALDSVAARALIAWSDPHDGARMSDLCQAGASITSVRAVLAFGQSGADGVIGLDDVFDIALDQTTRGDAGGTEIFQDQTSDDANAVATLTWDVSSSTDAGSAAARSHNQWIAAGSTTVVGAGLGDQPAILCPYPLNNLVSIGALMVPWVLNGGTLVLHRPFDLGVMCDQLAQTPADFTCLPLAMAQQLAQELDHRNMGGALGVLGVHWRNENPVPHGGEPTNMRWVDVVNLAEIALILRPSQAGQRDQPGLPRGEIQAGGGPATCEIRLKFGANADLGNEAEIRSPMAPSAQMAGKSGADNGRFSSAIDDQGFVATGLLCHRLGDDAMRITETGEHQARYGALAISLDELDELYKSHQSIADAAAFTQPDDIMGQRLIAAIIPTGDEGGAQVTLPDLTAHLHALGVAAFKHPDRLIFVKKIPRDAQGKVERGCDLALINTGS
ncbi:MAG: AMP-binding protein, partial [Alphaproteobacteria bacterium]